MKRNFSLLLAVASIPLFLASPALLRASDMHDRIQSSIQILDQKQHSDEPIPAELLNHAKGVAFFSITKVGLGLGGQGGEGIVTLRHSGLVGHSWTAPSAFNLSGGSIGAQIGYTEVHYIVVLNTDDAVSHFTHSGKVDWNATATGTAGSDTLDYSILKEISVINSQHSVEASLENCSLRTLAKTDFAALICGKVTFTSEAPEV